MANVILGIAAHDGRMDVGTGKAFWREASKHHPLAPLVEEYSLTDLSMTKLWCHALNSRSQANYFAMLHSDITPDSWWIDTLIDELERTGADFISALAPIKNFDGFYSTAISNPAGNLVHCRLTVKQANHPDFPTTFGVDEAIDALAKLPEPLHVGDIPRGGLLFANTGCMVCRLDKPWCEKVFFVNDMTIMRRDDGFFFPYSISEDWVFTRGIAKHGGRVMATKAVRLLHRGSFSFASHGDWGQDRESGVV